MVDKVTTDDVMEFNASFGDPSTLPEPVGGKTPTRRADKTEGEKSPIVQGNSPKTKTGMMSAVMAKLPSMTKEDMAKLHNSLFGVKDGYNEEVDNKNTVTVAETIGRVTAEDVDVSEDIEALFGSDDSLSEEFKTKVSTLFQAAVVKKINEHLDVISASAEFDITESVSNVESVLSEKLESYLDYVVESWVKENELAVDTGLKLEISEDFLSGLKGLFEEHYINIPEEKVDVVEELAAKLSEAETKLNEEMEKNIELVGALTETVREKAITEVGSDLTETQVEKFKTLAIGVEFVNEDTFRNKLKIIKENYFSKESTKHAVSEDALNSIDPDAAELNEQATNQPSLSGPMARYAATLSRHAKK